MPPPYLPPPPTTTRPTKPSRRIHCILSESHTSYLIQWAGIDPYTGTPRPTWELKANVPASAIAHWEDVKAGNTGPPRLTTFPNGPAPGDGHRGGESGGAAVSAGAGVRGGECRVMGASAAGAGAIGSGADVVGSEGSGSAPGGVCGGTGGGRARRMGVAGLKEGVVASDGDVTMAGGGTTTSGVGAGGGAGVGSRGVGAATCAGGGGGVESVDSAGFARPETSVGAVGGCRDAGAAGASVMPAAVVHSTTAPSTDVIVDSSEEAAMTPDATVLEIAVSTILRSLHEACATADSGHATSDLGGPGRATVSFHNGHSADTDSTIGADTPTSPPPPPPPPTISERAVKAVAEATGIMYAVEVVCAAAGARCVDFASARAESEMSNYNTANTRIATGEAGRSGEAAEVPAVHYAHHPPNRENNTMTMDLPTTLVPTVVSDDEIATDPSTATSDHRTPSHSSGSGAGSTYQDDDMSMSGDSDHTLDTGRTPATTDTDPSPERPASPTTIKRSILVHHMIYLNTQFDALEAEFHECVRVGNHMHALRVRERMGGIVICLGGARMALALESWV
ncbi:hypothetical protein DFP73DRAFT_596056 [Morchella snyderi]|nr:hypothetical protein DFP73DRAFT_596056 [Morchella snyderi]